MVARTCSDPGVTRNGTLTLRPRGKRLLAKVGGARHVFVTGVGTRPDQGGGDFHGPAVFFRSSWEGFQAVAKIRGERPIDKWWKVGEVDLNNLVVVATFIRSEEVF